MAQIVPKLNLNKTPSIVESNSLIFAKNIRLDVDNSIRRDYGIFPMSIHKGNNINNLVDYKNILNRIISDIDNELKSSNIGLTLKSSENIRNYIYTIYKRLLYISGEPIVETDSIVNNGVHKLVGIIPNNNEFYIFINGMCVRNIKSKIEAIPETYNFIICYDEKKDKFYPCNCNWNWSGGTITGCVINNILGEKILNIAESADNLFIPFKCINLHKSDITDDESIYTQAPTIPITNLNYIRNFSYSIPNGVYQFFIRYKIRDNFYTNWFPASKELFAGNKNIINTSFGTVKTNNIHKDSDNSFVFSVEHLFISEQRNYKAFQIGFIISHDDVITARAWKHFNFNTYTINFDYNSKDAYEIEVTDLLKNTYQLYNIGNITSFKNKIYISNYNETNFNEDNQEFANRINIELLEQNEIEGYDGYKVIETNINGNDVISGLEIASENIMFNGTNGIINRLLISKNNNDESIKFAILDSITSNSSPYINFGSELWSIKIKGYRTDLYDAQSNFIYEHKGTNFIFDDDIRQIKINNKSIPIKNDKNILLNDIISFICKEQRYLNKNCVFVNKLGIEDYQINIDIVRPCRYQKIETGGSDLIESTYTQTIFITLLGDITKYKSSDTSLLLNYTTLIPYQKYKFYIHYVKKTGEVTNGYYCDGINGGIKTVPFKSKIDSIIYPKFTNITLPKNYVACFFSVLHVEGISATVYNIDTTNIKGEANCIDVNLGIINKTNNITIKQGYSESLNEIKTNTAKYYDCNDTSDLRYFGANGIITFDKTSNITEENNDVAYIVTDYKVSETEDVQLIKCTPFINPEKLSKENGINYYNLFDNMNLLGFVCAINPLNKDRVINYYTDGSTVYLKEGVKQIPQSPGSFFNFVELKNHLQDTTDIKKRLTALYILDTENAIYIYSNYNLNYISLYDDPTEVYKTYYNSTSEETTDKSIATGSIILRLFKSLTMSYIYNLPSMYNSYTRKTYNVYNKNEITRFDNTIRSSELIGDESSINIYKFDANDYYNVPTNRGYIVNMLSVGDVILVHTEDSIFKFSGSNTLQSSNGEIKTIESNVFDTGISEVFGSDFGFAGLQYKSDHITTEKGYIFFDRDSRIIYMYSGQGQIIKLSDSIEKLFRHRDIETVRFANDYYNNRFFISILFYENYTDPENEQIIEKEYYPVTLSFNITDSIKSFVSLHDFYYDYSFNTKTKCYFLTKDNLDICTISKKYKSCYTKLEISDDNIYPQKKEINIIYVSDKDISTSKPAKHIINMYNSIVDIIDNNNYELIKTLNSISWCGCKIDSEFRNIKLNDEITLNMVEEVNEDIPCKYIRIYSDTCMTNLLNCTIKSNDKSISDINYPKYPFYNQGSWNFNYFRNILNSKEHKHDYIADYNSLIKGKYFVVRFIFNSDFKLETLSLNYNYKQ